MFKSNKNPQFRSKFSEDIFYTKYSHKDAETMHELAATLVEDVCQDQLRKSEKDELISHISELRFIPGGRYLYYAGRPSKFFNNCYLLDCEEDTREDWANLSWKAESCLMTGGGIGADYSVYRAEGKELGGTGGIASGPLPKMQMINEIGRRVMQGGSRRSAIYASLNWKHEDIGKFLSCKNWKDMPIGTTGQSLFDVKQDDFNFPAPLDMTNISVNYDTEWLLNYWNTGDVGDVFLNNVRQALSTAEPGFSFNFFEKENETLRNACTEVTANNRNAADGGDDSDVCNLGSLNFARIADVSQLRNVVELATKFLICGTLRAQLPYDKVHKTREKNRRLGLGLMGLHEWLIQRGSRYETTEEMHRWLKIYKSESDRVSDSFSDEIGVSRPVAKRAVAPTGTIGIIAGTSTGVEPIFAVAYKRRYLKNRRWHYQYVVDSAAQEMIELYGADPDKIESAIDLATDYERRLSFQANIQEYVDMSISSTINLPAWGSKDNNEDLVVPFANTLAKYAHRLRGFTCYPDGSRGGQPLTCVPYKEAVDKLGEEFEENIQTHDICEISGAGGVCGV
jgi:ribonucleoside-diphosphate reductase alpha chain|tara:strand:+ start:1541 stop:3241 length:1701 start_codon:yes stop_codon:yes gene_type:complete